MRLLRFNKFQVIVGSVLIACLTAGLLLMRLGSVSHSSITDDGKFAISPRNATLTSQSDESSRLKISIQILANTEVVIEKVGSSCGCTIVQPTTGRNLAAGAKTELMIQARIPSTGSQKSLVYFIAQGRRYEIPLTLEGPPETVPRLLDFPKNIELVGYGDQHPVVSRLIEFGTIEKANSPTWIQGVTSSDGEIAAKLEMYREDKVKDLTAVRRNYRVSVSAKAPGTNDPTKISRIALQCGTLSHQIQPAACAITIKTLATVRLVPSELVFTVPDSKELPVERTVLVVYENDVSEPLLVENMNPSFFDASIQDMESRRIRQVKVRLVSIPILDSDQAKRFEITLKPGIPEMEMLKLPVWVR